MRWRYGYTVLALCTLAFAATMVARLAISPVVPIVRADLGLSNTLVGVALSGMWAAYALSQFPSGVFGDKFGERRVILAAVGLTAVASLLLALSPNAVAFTLFAIVLGAGAGLHYSVATTFITKQFDDIGRAIGVHVSGGPVAGLLAPPVAAALGARYGWRVALLLGAAVALPVFVVFWWRIEPSPPERPEQPVRERFELGPVVELLRRPEIAYTTLLAVLGAFTWQATASFLPAFFEGHHGLSPAMASLFFSAYFLIHGATQPLTGALSDRFDRDSAATLTMALGVFGFSLLVVSDSAVAWMGAVLLVGVAMSWGAPVQSRFMDHLSRDERGAGFGLVRTVYMILGASGSVVVGLLADLAGWDVAFGLLAGVMAVGLLALLVNRLFKLGV
ncbi:MFS family permease [Halalkaliarchaeum sp. AArc-CO]|uniref:MFS transporter n=1 Tax=unclassified Halalkaliarchaeum TaxID=2678344 RepID=UPI00217D5114|nr:MULTISPECIES: MFS transporter [unclassified Halalkaliarchaeum]MDR5674142.1 MFS transporter [Halalkaliarchaeum sp. AArc-GB]UWG50863.1 MFS family permease [Halalkaliarchaeum sp. AArc-CO]